MAGDHLEFRAPHAICDSQLQELELRAALTEAKEALADAVSLIEHKGANPKMQQRAIERVESALANHCSTGVDGVAQKELKPTSEPVVRVGEHNGGPYDTGHQEPVRTKSGHMCGMQGFNGMTDTCPACDENRKRSDAASILSQSMEAADGVNVSDKPAAWRVKKVDGLEWVYFDTRPNWHYENGFEVEPLFAHGVDVDRGGER